ncbi:uncharacterized protein L969DRAFT_92178 [Mixia osmundae IAM 14324]|uniref:Uncharacterized protein n=1 Tax=Mixia osmundae (strain CBS 9802 / IAM 14324 / JCM 22182 / KY 12970) TaxID=764103 RepID=G7DT36_MIXOS|nr:uncharacterized protein L969DRAFT_92178 [Mixia osmundae IAM 14324]KEI42752.1 hypothetical protein L969DRAFT_92178 [Mixia osmundae IAM 14324]GAA93915.1 hypothetical protein E5Q_00561 [Mixia osmundae IAM 14324]
MARLHHSFEAFRHHPHDDSGASQSSGRDADRPNAAPCPTRALQKRCVRSHGQAMTQRSSLLMSRGRRVSARHRTMRPLYKILDFNLLIAGASRRGKGRSNTMVVAARHHDHLVSSPQTPLDILKWRESYSAHHVRTPSRSRCRTQTYEPPSPVDSCDLNICFSADHRPCTGRSLYTSPPCERTSSRGRTLDCTPIASCSSTASPQSEHLDASFTRESNEVVRRAGRRLDTHATTDLCLPLSAVLLRQHDLKLGSAASDAVEEISQLVPEATLTLIVPVLKGLFINRPLRTIAYVLTWLAGRWMSTIYTQPSSDDVATPGTTKPMLQARVRAIAALVAALSQGWQLQQRAILISHVASTVLYAYQGGMEDYTRTISKTLSAQELYLLLAQTQRLGGETKSTEGGITSPTRSRPRMRVHTAIAKSLENHLLARLDDKKAIVEELRQPAYPTPPCADNPHAHSRNRSENSAFAASLLPASQLMQSVIGLGLESSDDDRDLIRDDSKNSPSSDLHLLIEDRTSDCARRIRFSAAHTSIPTLHNTTHVCILHHHVTVARNATHDTLLALREPHTVKAFALLPLALLSRRPETL